MTARLLSVVALPFAAALACSSDGEELRSSRPIVAFDCDVAAECLGTYFSRRRVGHYLSCLHSCRISEHECQAFTFKGSKRGKGGVCRLHYRCQVYNVKLISYLKTILTSAKYLRPSGEWILGRKSCPLTSTSENGCVFNGFCQGGELSNRRVGKEETRLKMALRVRLDRARAGLPLRLMEQTHCARCWRPLRLSLAWPGPRVDLLPPDPTDRSLRAGQCGHVYHGSCARDLGHCPACHVFLQSLTPVLIEEGAPGNPAEPVARVLAGQKADGEDESFAQARSSTPIAAAVPAGRTTVKERIATLQRWLRYIADEARFIRERHAPNTGPSSY